MIKLFGNGTLKYCNENEMISIHGQSILLEKCIEERKIEENQLLEQAKAKLKAMEKAKKIQEKSGKSPPIVEYEPETIPILKIIELRMKYSYQRDLRYMIKHIERDEYFGELDGGSGGVVEQTLRFQEVDEPSVVAANKLRVFAN